ncbi:MAG: TonB-dependent receptor [Asticcacaulis sp.]
MSTKTRGLPPLLGAALLASTGLCGGLISLVPATALAQSATARDYNIPAGTLANALNDFAEQSGLRLIYAGELVQGRQSAGLKGRFSANDGLSRLLTGSGLTYRITGNSVSLEKAPVADGAIQLGTIRVDGATSGSGATGLSAQGTPRVGDSLTPPRDYISQQAADAGFDAQKPVTTITREVMDRTQPTNIFEALKDVPGLSVDGGPRVSGMRFSIRGYGDAEEVAVKVDDLPKTFEKYRMSGMFIEPEMIKSVEVLRGPQASSAAIGGTIIAHTKDASDFLEGDRRFGAWAKLGYGFNNEETSGSAILYTRPFEWLDVVYNYSKRESNDIVQGDGADLKASAIESTSHLFKFSVFPTDDLKLTTSFVQFNDKGLQAYDAISLFNANFGYVIRDIDDLTVTQTVRYNPDNRFINLKLVAGKGHTDLLDTVLPGWAQNSTVPSASVGYCEGFNFFRANGTPGTAANSRSYCRGNRYDTYDFENTTGELTNNAVLWETDSFTLSTLVGLQYHKNEKVVKLHYDNPESSTRTLFNSGDKTVKSWFVQPTLEWGRFYAALGIRHDDYHIVATGTTRDTLEMYGFDPEIRSKTDAYSLQLAYDAIPDRLKLFANYGEGYRPALLDEYYMNAGQSSYCPQYTQCDGVFKDQWAHSIDVGATYHHPSLFGTDLGVTGKLTFFKGRTRNLINSFSYSYLTQSITQSGHDDREGTEWENRFIYKNLTANVMWSQTKGNIYYETVTAPLYTVPGSQFNVQLHYDLNPQWDINAGYRKISDRTVLNGLYTGERAVYATQPGYQLFNAGVRWKPTDRIALRLIGENLGDKYYNLDGGFAGTLGMPAMGRNVKLFLEMRY